MKTDAEISILWDNFDAAKTSGDKDEIKKAKNALAAEYYFIVQEVAKRVSQKLKEITAEECASYGVDGLYEAINKFDRKMGIQFRTFAPHRIRGAILDNIRDADWVPRLVRHRNAVVDKIKQSHYMKHGEYPGDEEMSEKLSCSQDQFEVLSKKSVPVGMVSMYNKPKDGQDNEFEEILNANDNDEPPILGLLREEMFNKLLGHDFAKLERKIVYLVYYEGLTMKEVASETKFSESRISQMHGDIIRRLKQKVERNPDYSKELQKILEPNI